MIFRSAWPDVEIADVPLADFVLRHAERLRDRPAIVDGPTGRTLTFGDLADQVKRAAAALHRMGFKQGDVFAIYSPNVPEYAVVLLAVASLGGVTTTVNPLYTVGELTKQLQDSRARFLITVASFLDKAREAAAQAGVEEIFAFDAAEGARPFAELLASAPSPPAVTIDVRNDVVILPYSSGTTGLPKGVMLTHANVVSNLHQCLGTTDWEGPHEGDVVLVFLPLFHIYGMVVILALNLVNGATTVLMPRFDFMEFLSLAQKYRATILPLVPPVVLAMAKSPAVGQFDLSSVRLVFCGAAPLSDDVARELAAKLNCPVTQGYGMTEASPVTHLSPTRNAPWKPGASGKIVCNTEVKLISVDTGEEVGIGQEGELLMRGPQIMKGYLGQPAATADAIDAEGWYHTGDVGYVDADGFFFIIDRTKELIKYKGLQVAPAELEAVLLTHPAVLDCAVFRKDDAEAGEVPKACVVLKPDDRSRATSADDLMAFVAERVAPHKRIRHLEFIDQVPKSASGKILRRVLIDRERDVAAGGPR
jgi:acyl-CoA synthetase (AMP-forming)/AMP-acid ligase II